jgi:hypothetical protein
LLTVTAAGTASAATLSYTGTLTFKFANLPSSSGGGAGLIGAVSVGGHLSALTFVGGEVGPITTSLPMTSPVTVNSVRLTAVANLSGTLTGISGGAPLSNGKMGLSGMAKICLVLGPCGSSFVPLPLTPTGTPPAGLGIGGTQLFTGATGYTTYSATGFIPLLVALTMKHMPWTIGTPTMTIHQGGSSISTLILPGGFAHGPASLTSSTAQPGGVLQLVTVSKVFTTLTLAWPELPVSAILNLHFVPEPGTLLLLGSGVAVLVILGRRRRSG